MPKKDRGITLIELIISMVIMAMVILGIFSIELLSRHRVISSEKRAKVQNEISYAIEYMSKYVQQSIGDSQLPAIRRYPSAGTQTGFQIGIDLNNPQTPKDLSDDTWVNFYLSGNSLIAQKGASSEVLTARISGVFAANTVMPNSPGQGFYVNITDPGPNQGVAVDIGLVGRYNPAVAASIDNPQISIKTRLVSPSSSAR